MSASDNLGRQFNTPKPKQRRTMAYRYDESGITFCPSCHKNKPDHLTEKPVVEYNTDYQLGMLVTCSGGCGRTIYGKKGTYE